MWRSGWRRGVFARLLRLATVLAVLCPPCAGWVLVSREGEVTLLGPVDIDPSFALDSRLRFRVKGYTEWDIYVPNPQDNLAAQVRFF